MHREVFFKMMSLGLPVLFRSDKSSLYSHKDAKLSRNVLVICYWNADTLKK